MTNERITTTNQEDRRMVLMETRTQLLAMAPEKALEGISIF